jgi:hypothetical protein
MSSRDSAEYQEIIIESNDGSKTADLRLGVASFRYYEDLFSPTITAKMIVVNTGGTVPGKDDKYESIYSGLPIRGGERISIKIKPGGNNPLIDFATKAEDYLYVSSVRSIIREGQRELFELDLVSRESITNETTRVHNKFPRTLKISEAVKKIGKDYLKVDIDADETQNQYGFYGNLKRPFNILVWLASKAVPVDGLAGFFFYQTKSGFKFKSVDKLISDGIEYHKKERPERTYTYNEVVESGIETDDFKILNYGIEVNNDLLKKLRLGTYSSFFAEFNPATGVFTLPQNGKFNLNDYTNKTKNLGGDPEIPKVVNDSGLTLADMPSRIIASVANIGTVDTGAGSITPNGSGLLYQRQALMRYNLLFMQQLAMMVPMNTNLEVGDVIKCNFPRISATKEYDREQSGLYMIKELCHSFDGTQSITSMKLIRDTYGEFGNA